MNFFEFIKASEYFNGRMNNKPLTRSNKNIGQEMVRLFLTEGFS